MPLLQAMSKRANECLNRDNIGGIDAELLTGDSLSQLAADLGIATTASELAYLDAWPSTMQEGLRAILVDAVKKGQPVTVAWAPAYDYQITLWEAADTDVSPGGLTLLLQGRYPGHDPVQGI